MSVRTYTQRLQVMQRTTIGPVGNCVLNCGNRGGPGWTDGVTQLDKLDPAIKPYSSLRTASDPWYILAFNIVAFLGLTDQFFSLNPVAGPFFGKFTKISAGLVYNEANSSSSNVAGLNGSPTSDVYANMLIPKDHSMIGTLWDPAVDPLPPMFTGYSGSVLGPATTPVPGQMLRAELTFNPPQPIAIAPGKDLLVGVWMPPSLLGIPSYSGGIHTLFMSGAAVTLQWDDAYGSQ